MPLIDRLYQEKPTLCKQLKIAFTIQLSKEWLYVYLLELYEWLLKVREITNFNNPRESGFAPYKLPFFEMGVCGRTLLIELLSVFEMRTSNYESYMTTQIEPCWNAINEKYYNNYYDNYVRGGRGRGDGKHGK
ncbi:MAG: hypothetical protein PVI90_00555 [Desulfobacteraceae bacterium]|jgi:hypothetical protein